MALRGEVDSQRWRGAAEAGSKAFREQIRVNAESPSAVPAAAMANENPPPTWFELGRYWGTVALWMLFISLLSTDPFSASNTNRYIDPVLRFLFPGITGPGFTIAHTVVRKTAHFSEFFVLGALLFWALRRGREPRWRLSWALQAAAFAGGYALLDEFHQLFVPSRTSSVFDSGIDLGGAVISQLVIYLRGRWARRAS